MENGHASSEEETYVLEHTLNVNFSQFRIQNVYPEEMFIIFSILYERLRIIVH